MKTGDYIYYIHKIGNTFETVPGKIIWSKDNVSKIIGDFSSGKMVRIVKTKNITLQTDKP